MNIEMNSTPGLVPKDSQYNMIINDLKKTKLTHNKQGIECVLKMFTLYRQKFLFTNILKSPLSDLY